VSAPTSIQIDSYPGILRLVAQARHAEAQRFRRWLALQPERGWWKAQSYARERVGELQQEVAEAPPSLIRRALERREAHRAACPDERWVQANWATPTNPTLLTISLTLEQWHALLGEGDGRQDCYDEEESAALGRPAPPTA